MSGKFARKSPDRYRLELDLKAEPKVPRMFIVGSGEDVAAWGEGVDEVQKKKGSKSWSESLIIGLARGGLGHAIFATNGETEFPKLRTLWKMEGIEQVGSDEKTQELSYRMSVEGTQIVSQVRLRVDRASHLPLTRTVTIKNASVTLEGKETYTDFKLDTDLSDDLFKHPK